MQENHGIHIGKEIQKKLTAEQRSVAGVRLGFGYTAGQHIGSNAGNRKYCF